MDSQLAIAYLSALIILLSVVAALVIRQIIKNRRQEQIIAELQPKLQKGKGTGTEHYQLGAVYLRKKLYAKAIAELQKAIKEPDAPLPEAYNALGYVYFCQEQYDLAIKHYREALELQPQYIAALNNLAHAYEKKRLIPQAIEMYERTLSLDSKNDIAKRRLSSLKKRV